MIHVHFMLGAAILGAEQERAWGVKALIKTVVTLVGLGTLDATAH